MKILLLPRYTPAGASSRYRSFLYIPYLRAQGHEITVTPFLSDLYIERLYGGKSVDLGDLASSFARRIRMLLGSRRFDLIWLEGEAFPWMPSMLEALFLRGDVPYVVDYDDALFHRYDTHSSALVRGVLGRKIDRIMAGAAAVIAGNEYLASRARSAGARRIEIIPTVVDLRVYPGVPPMNNGKFTIGWVGSMSTAKYLTEIQNPLRTILRDNGNVRFVVVGARPPEMEGVTCQTAPWSEEQEMEEMKRFDVGIMPLVDSPWERGKCGHKLIKYMGCFVPVIASPVGVNVEIVDHGENGFLVRNSEEWTKAFEKLRGDPALRERMGIAGRKKVERLYSVDVTAPRLAEVFNSIVPSVRR